MSIYAITAEQESDFLIDQGPHRILSTSHSIHYSVVFDCAEVIELLPVSVEATVLDRPEPAPKSVDDLPSE
jgi:hypothetical protein